MCYTGHVKKSGISRLSEIQEIPDMRHAPLAQLDRASGYGPEGREFESCHVHLINPVLSVHTDDAGLFVYYFIIVFVTYF